MRSPAELPYSSFFACEFLQVRARQFRVIAQPGHDSRVLNLPSERGMDMDTVSDRPSFRWKDQWRRCFGCSARGDVGSAPRCCKLIGRWHKIPRHQSRATTCSSRSVRFTMGSWVQKHGSVLANTLEQTSFSFRVM